MTATSTRQKLYDYIRVAEDKKVKAIYTMLEEEIEEAHNYWNDKDFIKELDKRSADYKTGKIKAVPWEEAKAQILNSTKLPVNG
jgi:putative addiction module component (TIGR02574 family)